MTKVVRVFAKLCVLVALFSVFAWDFDDVFDSSSGFENGFVGAVGLATAGVNLGLGPEKEEMAGFGKHFRDARVRAGLTLREAAKRIGVTEDGLGKVERDENGASLATMVKMASVYGVEVGDLLPHTPSPLGDAAELHDLLLLIRSIPAERRAEVIENLTQQASMLAGLIAPKRR